jgi:hypothetical protein
MIELKELHKEDIACRAYELYVQRGSESGNDVEDWLRAEKELGAESIVTPARTKTTQMGQSN